MMGEPWQSWTFRIVNLHLNVLIQIVAATSPLQRVSRFGFQVFHHQSEDAVFLSPQGD